MTTGFAAGRRDDVDLVALVVAALGGEGDVLAVRRPDGAGVLAGAVGELLLRRAVGGEQPQVGAAVVLVGVVGRDLDDAPLAVRGHRRRADALDGPEVL